MTRRLHRRAQSPLPQGRPEANLSIAGAGPASAGRSPSTDAVAPPPSFDAALGRRPVVCDHDWRWNGQSPNVHAACDFPGRLVCYICNRTVDIRCGATRSSECVPCSESHRKRLAQVCMSGVTGERFGQYFWCTLTAPGADVLDWDTSACSHAPEVPCSGSLGCVVDEFDAAVWNGNAPKRWSWFMTYLRRRFGENVQYFGVWEDQRRGVLHRHFLVRIERPVSERRVRAAVRGAARSWGFGSQYDVRSITGDAAREAWYCAKYATKSADSVASRRRLDPRTGEVRQRPGFRAWSCSRDWGDTMAAVRERQRRYVPVPPTVTTDAAPEGRSLDPNTESSTLGVSVLGASAM